LPLIDVLISSKEFRAFLTGIDRPASGAHRDQNEVGCRLVGLTKVDAVQLFLRRGIPWRRPLFKCPSVVLDTTGAGDAFMGFYLLALFTREEIEMRHEEVRLRCAALGCRALGARTALPTREELNAFLAR